MSNETLIIAVAFVVVLAIHGFTCWILVTPPRKDKS